MVPKDSAKKAPAKKAASPKLLPERELDVHPETGEQLGPERYWDVARKKVVTRIKFDPTKHCGAARPQSLDGSPCKNPKGYRTDHLGYGWCHRHLGLTPHGIAEARKEQLAQAVQTYGLPVNVSPEQALLDEVQRTAGHVIWLGAKVRELAPDELTWGIAKRSKGRAAQGPVDLTEEQAAIPVLLQLYMAERKHLVDVSRAAVAAGISQKALDLAQTQATSLVSELSRLVDDLAESLRLSEARRRIVEDQIGKMLFRLSAVDSTGPRLIAGEIIGELLAPERV